MCITLFVYKEPKQIINMATNNLAVFSVMRICDLLSQNEHKVATMHYGVIKVSKPS